MRTKTMLCDKRGNPGGSLDGRRRAGRQAWLASPLLIFLALTFASMHGFGEAIYIMTQGGATGWNLVELHKKVALSNLVNRAGAPTPVGISIATNFTGLTWNNATKTPIGDAAEFKAAGLTQAYAQNIVADIFIEGLLPGSSYDFTFYASYINTANNYNTLYQMQGVNLVSATLAAGGNTDQVARVQGVIADAVGKVRISVGKAPGNTGTYGLLMAMKIEGNYNVDRYVSAAGGDDTAGGYTNWAGAATTLQAAIDRSVHGDTVWVENGFVTDTGGRTNWPAGAVLTNRLVIDKAITVRSVSGDTNNMPRIVGAWDAGHAYGLGNNAVRGVYLKAYARLVGFLVTNCATRITTMNNSDGNGRGGGVLGESQATSVISNCVLVGNSSIVGGGAHSCLLVGCLVSDNAATGGSGNYRGGGGGCLCSMIDCTVRRNYGQGQGGGVYNGSFLRDCLIEENRAGGNGGNGVRGVTTLSNCVVRANSGGYVGGVSGGTLYDCVLMCNTGAAGYFGGGANGSVMYNCLVVSNVCYNKGGGVSGGTLYNCRIVGNRASGYGGAAADATLNNSLLVGNSTSGKNNGGGAGFGKLINCTLVGNSPGGDGGGVYGSVLTNCVSWGNSKPDTNHLAWYSCGLNYTNGGAIVGNLAVAPLIVNTNLGLYRLRGNSPCVNQGINLDWMTNTALVISRDLAGDLRVRDDQVDMGAYEYRAYGTRFFVR